MVNKAYLRIKSEMFHTFQWEGGTYTGEHEKRVPNGYGEIINNDGSKFKGWWVNGHKNGYGRYFKGGKEYIVQKWRYGKLDTELEVTVSTLFGVQSRLATIQDDPPFDFFVDNIWSEKELTRRIGTVSGIIKQKNHGKGILIWNNGNRYYGDFKEGGRTGKGTLYFSDGAIYRGDFVEGRREGYGVYLSTDGTRSSGRFLNGRFHGEIIVDYPNGACATFEYDNGTKLSCKRFRASDASVFKGEFENGHRIKGKSIFKDGSYYDGDY